jgi:hypothetical protein
VLGSLAIVVAALAPSLASPAPLTCGWTKTFKLPVFSDATHPAAIGTAAATAAADAWASGYSTNAITGAKQALMLRWNGSSWKVVATPDPTRDSVGWVAAKKGEVWAVGGSPSGA